MIRSNWTATSTHHEQDRYVARKVAAPLSVRKETAKHSSPHGPSHPSHYAAYVRKLARLNKRKNRLLVIDRRGISRRRQRIFEHMPTGIFPVRKSGPRPLRFCFQVVAPHRFRPALTLVRLLCAQCLMTSPALHESSVSESTWGLRDIVSEAALKILKHEKCRHIWADICHCSIAPAPELTRGSSKLRIRFCRTQQCNFGSTNPTNKRLVIPQV